MRESVDLGATNRLTFGIKLTQAEEFLAGMHKIANRITVGVVIAALLVSSALMMRVESRFAILGYPGLAVMGYLIAAVAAVYLIYTTLKKDRVDREKIGRASCRER